jgi:hypothetical protein
MDQDTLELVRLLCCRAGMLMEDTCPVAIALPSELAPLRAAIAELLISINQMRDLGHAIFPN